MEGRIALQRGHAPALLALAFILAITGLWWALALWPLPDVAPAWLLGAREVCFGSTRSSMPDAAGWMLLVLEPAAALTALLVIWGRQVREALRSLARTDGGRVALAAGALVVTAGIILAGVRVAEATAAAAALRDSPTRAALPSTYPRLDREPPPLSLINQAGDTVRLSDFSGRPVLVTFAFAHCATVCPVAVREVLGAARAFQAYSPVVVIVTLDPWRDTPQRLRSIATQWGLHAADHVLSGTTEQVERTLEAWNVPTSRDPRTGDVTHPSLAYVVDRDGKLAYVATARSEHLVELMRRL